MKPTKNRIFCPSCQSPKMLFESKEKADNFIRFNHHEFENNGKKPVRSYYCVMCSGWHVTSVSSEGKGVERDKVDLELLDIALKSLEDIPSSKEAKVAEPKQQIPKTTALCNVEDAYNKYRKYIEAGFIGEADEIAQDVPAFLEVLSQDNIWSSLYPKYRNRFDILMARRDWLYEFSKLPYESMLAEYERQLAGGSKDMTKAMHVIIRIVDYDSRIDVIEQLIEHGNIDEAWKKSKAFRQELRGIHGLHMKEIRGKYNSKLDRFDTKKFREQIQESYREKILDIIEMIEEIDAAYNNQMFDTARKVLDIAFDKLSKIKGRDDDVQVLSVSLDEIKKKLDQVSGVCE